MNQVVRTGALLTTVLAAILLPFALFGGAMDDWAVTTLEAPSGSGLAALIVVALLAADIVLPTPSSVVSTASGAMLGFVPGAIAGWIGMTLGCVLGFWLGTSGSAAADRLVGSTMANRMSRLTERFGDAGLILVRAVPVMAEASVLLAGMARMDRSRFLLATSLANAGISAAYAAVGAYSVRTSSFLWAFAGAVLLPAIAWAAMTGLSRRRRTP